MPHGPEDQRSSKESLQIREVNADVKSAGELQRASEERAQELESRLKAEEARAKAAELHAKEATEVAQTCARESSARAGQARAEAEAAYSRAKSAEAQLDSAKAHMLHVEGRATKAIEAHRKEALDASSMAIRYFYDAERHIDLVEETPWALGAANRVGAECSEAQRLLESAEVVVGIVANASKALGDPEVMEMLSSLSIPSRVPRLKIDLEWMRLYKSKAFEARDRAERALSLVERAGRCCDERCSCA